MDYRNLEPDVYTEKVHFHIYRIGGGEFFFKLKICMWLEYKSIYKAKTKLKYMYKSKLSKFVSMYKSLYPRNLAMIHKNVLSCLLNIHLVFFLTLVIQ